VKTLVRLIAFAAVLATLQSLALAQNGQRFGFTATDRDNPAITDHEVYRINLDNPGATSTVGTTGVPQELEGFFSVDGPTNSRLFGVAENPDATSTGDPSVLVDLSPATCGNGGKGVLIGPTGINFGTEAGSAWNPLTGIAYSVASDDLNLLQGTVLYMIDPSTGGATPISQTPNLYLDGLAFGGDGTLYGSDARPSDSLYKYDFDNDVWVLVGQFGIDLNEDSGLANYRGVGGGETNLYLITEGDGPLPGRLWTVNATTGALALVGDIRFPDGSEVPEDLEGFDIPWKPIACN
jgi:hypothetical protein